MLMMHSWRKQEEAAKGGGVVNPLSEMEGSVSLLFKEKTREANFMAPMHWF